MNNIDTKVPLIVEDNNFQTIALHSRWFRPLHSSFIIPHSGLVSKYVTDACERCTVHHPLGVWNWQHHEVRTLHSGLLQSGPYKKVKSKSSSISKLPSSPPPPCWETSQRGRMAEKVLSFGEKVKQSCISDGLRKQIRSERDKFERWT